MISRRLALGGLAAAPLLGAAARKREIPPPVTIPFRIGENTPWTTVAGGGGEPIPFVLSLISNFLHCDPSVLKDLGAVKDARWGLSGWRVDKVIVGGALGIDGMPLIPYENYYTQRMVAGTFELNVFPIYQIDWDRQQVMVIYDPQATGDEAFDELEQPHSDTNIFPTLFAKVNGKKAYISSTVRISGKGLTKSLCTGKLREVIVRQGRYNIIIANRSFSLKWKSGKCTAAVSMRLSKSYKRKKLTFTFVLAGAPQLSSQPRVVVHRL